MRKATRKQANSLYREVLAENDLKAQLELVKSDLFYLLTVACNREDIDHDWLYDRCREVEESPNEHLDLWAREHYKSTIITFGKTIQDILNNPNLTFGIFSHTRPIAKAFLDQIKREFESNNYLINLFPEILYVNPRHEAEKWSLDSGIIVKRPSNPKEATVEAWGLVDGQPTGKHFDILIYDDIVTRESVTTPDQIKKTTAALELSYNLGSQGGHRRFIGTRYHFNDTYREIIDRKTVNVRLHPAREGGKPDGKAMFMSEELLNKKRRDMGAYTFGSQMLQNPVADKAMGFNGDWIKYYKNIKPEEMNKFILVDPASEKKKTSDYTVMAVIGLGKDQNYYLIDMVRDRLNLAERTQKLFDLHRKYKPIRVGYEQYGAQADKEHIEYVQENNNYRFPIVKVGGQVKKEDRIKALLPVFEQERFWLPENIVYIDYQGFQRDLVKDFINDEYLAFPVSVHDDMLDCIARILDPKVGAVFPQEKKERKPERAFYSGHDNGWMG